MLAWVPLIVMLSLPWWVGTICALAHGVVIRHLLTDQRTLDWRARDWLRVLVHQHAVPTTVEVHADGIDGYWPAVDCIGLRMQTAASTHPVHYAIVAHELGHALNMRRNQLAEVVLPFARSAAVLAGQGTMAAACVAALYDSTELLAVAFSLAVISAASHVVIAADEAAASLRVQDVMYEELPIELLWRARWAQLSGFSVYAARTLGALVVVAGWPLISWQVLGSGFAPAEVASTVGIWLLVTMLPVFALHASWVLLQVFRPQPIRSAFRLGQLALREGQWESAMGLATLFLIVALHDVTGDPIMVASVALAAIPTVAPAGQLAMLTVVVPVGLALTPLRPVMRPKRPFWLKARYVTPDDPRSLMALYSRPPWYLRALWLTRIAYLPMVAVLVCHLLGG